MSKTSQEWLVKSGDNCSSQWSQFVSLLLVPVVRKQMTLTPFIQGHISNLYGPSREIEMPMFSYPLFRMAALTLGDHLISFYGSTGRLYDIGLGVNCGLKSGYLFLFMNLILSVNRDP